MKPSAQVSVSPAAGRLTKVPLPEQLSNKNMVIEISSDKIQRFKTYYSTQMVVKLNENFGELNVTHRQTLLPLPRAYVKVFCKDTSGSELFYRDGFTDIRGKFEYANASGKSVDTVEKFGIFVSDDKFGQVILEAGKPKLSKH